MKLVITLVATQKNPLSRERIGFVRDLLKQNGAGDIGVFNELAPEIACDITFTAERVPDIGIFEQALAESQTDVFICPVQDRRKKLLLADMDSTIIQEETLDEIAAHLGIRDKIAPITERAMRGELDFKRALAERVALLKGVNTKQLLEVRDKMRLMPGAVELVGAMRASGATCILISGGFEQYTGFVAGKCGFHADIGNRFVIDGDSLTGAVHDPVVDKNMKRATLEWYTSALKLKPSETMAVGDGANDIPMLRAAGAGVAYHAKPKVVSATAHHVRYADLAALLYLQGYRQSEISA